MAHAPVAASDAGAGAAATKDVVRFRQFLKQGAPGPHAYVILLGMDTFDPPALFRALRKGFAYRAFEHFSRNSALPAERVMALIGVPRRTLTRRKREGRFLPEESDRLLRASRLFGQTLQLFEGDQAAATDWLETAQPALGGTAPLDLAATDAGVREVERLIGRLEHGVFS
jgi:putative toxin-antitoxin system antitoxin component (TIGR02293 family)